MQALLTPSVLNVLKTLEIRAVTWDTADACNNLAIFFASSSSLKSYAVENSGIRVTISHAKVEIIEENSDKVLAQIERMPAEISTEEEKKGDVTNETGSAAFLHLSPPAAATLSNAWANVSSLCHAL